MSDTSGSRPADASSGDATSDASTESIQSTELTGSSSTEATGTEQPTPEQPYDVPSGAQQYGQPPATGYQPPATDPPGRSAPVEGPGPQQYGQPEHGQASYAQEGFPSQPSSYAEQGQGQQPGYQEQQGYPGQPGYPGQQGYQGQQPYPGQQPYQGGQQSYQGGGQPYQGQQPYGGPAPYPNQGYPQAYGQQSAPMSDSDQRLWATLTNISTVVVGFVGPLVAYLVLKDRSSFLKDSTTEALNFSILFSIAIFVSSLLTTVFIGAILLPIVWVVGIVFCILAAIASNKGELYRYPVNWRLVK